MREQLRVLALVAMVSGTIAALPVPGSSAPAQDEKAATAQGSGQVSLPDPAAPGKAATPVGRIAFDVVASPIHGTNIRAAGGPGTGTQSELSMSVSGPSIVITFNGGTNGGGYVCSQDGGRTFGAITSPPRPAGSTPCCDTGVASDLNGRFYYLELYRNDGAGNCTNSVHVSTNGGQTFGNIVGSPFSYGPGTDFPDQPHIALDRVHLVAGNPQLYVTTRHFTAGINCPQTGGGGTVQGEVTCSTNGGAAWIAPIVLAPFTDTSHMAVGSDGSVYLVGNGVGTILLRRSTNDCNTGLAFGAAVTVASGLTFGALNVDREFAQPYVAVDRLNPSVAYVAWSSDRLAGDNDRDVFLCRCTFTGTAGTCDTPVRVNDDPIGSGNDQYFPNLCIDPNNTIGLSWNDQRDGAGSTAIYHSEIRPNGASFAISTNFRVSEVNFTPFNFGGTPDYGDYNENVDACNAEHLYAAWVSHVSPPGILPASNDPDIFFSVVNNVQDVRVAGPLDFGDVCSGGSLTRELRVMNVGDATLTVSNVQRVAGSTDFTIDPEPIRPVTIGPNSHVSFFVRCTPTGLGFKTATIRVTSDDPDRPQIDLTATSTVGPPDIRVTGSTDFGDVCLGGGTMERTISVCNVGACDLNVSSVDFSPACSDFILVNNPFPAVVAPNACIDVVVRYTPTTTGPHSCTLVVSSNDPDTPSVPLTVTASALVAGIDVPPDLAFPPTVYQDAGACHSLLEFPISNQGPCDLTITNIALAGPDAGDYSFVGLPSFPILLGPGEVVGDGDFRIRFAPTEVDRNRVADIEVTYVTDPITATTATVTRHLCGEGTRTGVRILVTAQGHVVPLVKSIKVRRLNANAENPELNTVSMAMNLIPQIVNPGSPCPEVMYHREIGTAATTDRLLAGNYEVTATVRLGLGLTNKSVGFDVRTCDFHTLVIDFNESLAQLNSEPSSDATADAAIVSKTQLVGIYPNPFRAAASVGFNLVDDRPTRVEVFDARGILVRSLVAGMVPMGRYEIEWNGRDAAGSPAANGIYFFRLTAGDLVQTKKAVLMR